MIRAYLDSSAFLKRFNEEKGSSVAVKLFSACENGEIELATSQWTIGETIAAIDKKLRRDEITEEVRDANIKSLLELTGKLAHKKFLMIIPLDQNVVSASWKYITSDHLSADDALQLLSFMIINSEAFLASDKYLLENIKQEGINGYNIEDENDATEIIRMLE